MTAQRTIEVPEPVGAEQVTARAPERLVTLGLEARPSQQHLGPASHMESKMLAALHEWRRLDHKQGVVLHGPSRTHERSRAREAIGGSKAEALVERLSSCRIRNE